MRWDLKTLALVGGPLFSPRRPLTGLTYLKTMFEPIHNDELKNLIEENIFEVSSQGLESQSQLLCEVQGRNGAFYQVHLFVTQDEDSMMDNNNFAPVYELRDGEIIGA